MKKITFIITAFTVCFAFGQQTNLMLNNNPSFEDSALEALIADTPASNWEISYTGAYTATSTVSIVSDTDHTGGTSQMAKIETIGQSGGATHAFLKNVAWISYDAGLGGQTIKDKLLIWIKTDDPNTSINGQFKIARELYESDATTLIKKVSASLTNLSSTWAESLKTATFKDDSKVVIPAHAGINYIKIYFEFGALGENDANTYTTLIDDLKYEIQLDGVTLGEDEITIEDPNLKLWPNPASTHLNIRAPLGKTFKKAGVYNLLGQELMLLKNATDQIDISNLNKGMYFFKLESDDGAISTRRFTKN